MRVRRRAGIMLTLVTLVTGLALGLALPGGSAVAQGICTELITDGGLESGAGWTLGLDPAQPQYVTGQVHAGARALQLGIPTGAPNQRSYSSVRQLVTIAPDAAQVTLNFWYLALMPGAPTTDYVEMALLGPDGHDLLDKPWRSFVNNRLWNGAGFDLSSWRGQTLQVYFNVYNDGLGPSATMYLDDVSLQACTGGPATGTVTPTASWTPTGAPTLTPTPTALPTWTLTPYPTALPTWTLTPAPLATVTPYPTASLTPTGLPAPTLTPAPTVTGPPPTPYPPIGPPSPDCIDLLMNGDFEQGVAGWELAPNKLPVLLVGAPSVHSGVYAVRLGTQETSGVQSYSSIRQQVYIPPGYAQILWQFWTWTWAETPAGSDHQEADFLDPDPAVLQKFWRVLTNDQAWVPHSIPVTNYSGRTVVVYLNDYNDGVGGRSAMFLDDVHLWACPGALSAAAAAVPPAAPPPAAAAAPAAAAPVAPLPAPTATATVAPIMTVLTLVTVTPSPLPATATSSALVQTPPPPALGPIVVAATPTRTPTPAPGFLDRVAAALHLPPPPPYWPLGLLAIVIVLLLLFVLLRQPAP